MKCILCIHNSLIISQGFHLCALIRQLSDILPTEPRLKQLREACFDLSKQFVNGSSCIEILGKSGHIECVYFPVRHSRALQWSEQHIKVRSHSVTYCTHSNCSNTHTLQDSREEFLHSVEISTQKEKLNGFVGFCEDTIFEVKRTIHLLYQSCVLGNRTV